MHRRLLLMRISAGVVGGVVGFLAGILALLAVDGSNPPNWGPMAAAGGAGVVGGGGLAVTAGRTGRCLVRTILV